MFPLHIFYVLFPQSYFLQQAVEEQGDAHGECAVAEVADGGSLGLSLR
jgi:hypothetical protein